MYARARAFLPCGFRDRTDTVFVSPRTSSRSDGLASERVIVFANGLTSNTTRANFVSDDYYEDRMLIACPSACTSAVYSCSVRHSRRRRVVFYGKSDRRVILLLLLLPSSIRSCNMRAITVRGPVRRPSEILYDI